jgi:hypothetical protein
METIKVYSPIEDKNINKNLNDSPIWRRAIHVDDLDTAKEKYHNIWEYSIKFDGLRPIQVTNIVKFK